VSERATVSDGQGQAQSIADLVERMARTLEPSLGDRALAEARDLLALMHEEPRHWSLMNAARIPASDEIRSAMRAAERRAAGAPLESAAGRAAFGNRELEGDVREVIPRPETELLVDIVLELTGGTAGGIAVDVGTGSGAIALALASEGTFAQVIGTDVSLDALSVARGNATRRTALASACVEFRHGSLLGPVQERPLRAVVSNPPYISFDEAAALPASVRDWEPAVALFSAHDGMDATARLVREAADALAPAGVFAVEVDMRRAATVAGLVAAHGAFAEVQVRKDLTGRERFVVARRLEEQG
jgi:release factor glutamine methyltransferase